MKKIDRAKAKEKGLHRYYTGYACTNSHKAERYTNNGACLTCVAERNKQTQEDIRAAFLPQTVTIDVVIHPKDKKVVWAFAKKLRINRGLK